MEHMIKDYVEVAANGKVIYAARDEAEIVAYGNGRAWVARDEIETEIVAYDPNEPEC